MTKRMTIRQLLEIVEGDEELVVRLVEHGIVERREEGFSPEEVERVLVCRTLVRELDVDPSALDIILRLRQQLLVTRRQVAVLAREVAELRGGEPTDER